MITPAFALTATERVLPKLALDFTTASLDSRITFTRITGASNPATYVNSSGYITSASNNQARFDYDPVALTCKGLLIEESRTNLCTYSETFQNWVATNVSVATNVAGVTSPDGGNTADSVTDDSTSGDHRVTQPVTTSTSTTYTASAYVKAGTGNYFFMSLSAGNVDDRYFTVIVDLSTGSVTQTATSTGSTLSSSSVTNAGGGWYRVTMSGSQSVTAVTGLRLGLAASATGNTIGARGTPSYSGTGSVLYIWGAQLETGAFATSYIPTTTTALTRNADVATMTGTNFSSWFNASEGTFVAQYIPNDPSPSNARGLFIADDGTVNNLVGVSVTTALKGILSLATGGSGAGALTANTGTVSQVNKVAGAYKVNDYAAALSGGTVATSTTLTLPTVTQARIGFLPRTGLYANATIQKLAFYPVRGINAQVQAQSK